MATTAPPAATSRVPSATPAPCLEGAVSPAPASVGALRIDYWSDGRLWEWAEETGVAVPYPLPQDIAAARISADGEWVAYQRILDERRSELWAMRTDRADARRLAMVDAAETYARYPDLYSADLGFDWVRGTHTVAFHVQPQFEGTGQFRYEAVRLADAETGAVQEVVPAGEVWHLAYAPDGGQLAALTEDELRLIDAADGRVQHRYQVPLTCGPWQSLAYSPDGRYLAVFHLAGIAIIDAHDGTRRDIPFAWKPVGMGEYCETPPILWLEDAPAFYTLIGKGETPDELLAPSATFTIWRIDAREATATALHTFTGSVLSAEVSPDRRRLAFWVQERDNTRHLYLADVESGRQVLYTSGRPDSILVFLGWNPDSARFVIKMSGLQLGEICGARVPLTGTAPGSLTWVDAERFLVLSCGDSPERCDLSLHTLSGEVTPVATLTAGSYYRVRFEAPGAAGPVSRLERLEDLCCPPRFAPGGHTHLTLEEGILRLHSLSGGAFAGLTWLPGTPYIVYEHVPEGNIATLQAEYQVVSAAGGPPKTLFSNGLGLTLSPDGRIISFVRDLEGEEETGNWIAVLEYEGAG